MNYQLVRFNSQGDYTIGTLFVIGPNRTQFLAYTLEDEFRTKKVRAETRIPAGTYRLKIRTEGKVTKRYEKRFPDIHKGMIWLQDVPNFKYIYIHCGNDDDDTEGCILIGNGVIVDHILNSRKTYSELYPQIYGSILTENTYLEIIDYDTPGRV